MEILLYVFLGVAIGFFTGIIPGIHPNVLAGLAFFIPFSPMNASVLLVSAAVTHTFVDYIPSIFLGAPNDDTSLSVLPGHQMLLEGKGMEGLALTVAGGIGSVLFLILSFPIASRFFPLAYEWIRPHVHIILIIFSFWMMRKGKWTALVFLMSGLIGYIVLDMHFLGAKGFLPMFTGMFGIPTLIFASDSKIPKQILTWSVSTREFLTGSVLGSLGGMFVGLMPGIGSAQASAFIQEITNKSKRTFLSSIGAINTSDAIISILALWMIGNPRSGVAVAVGNLISLQFNEYVLLIVSVVVAASMAVFVSLNAAKATLRVVEKINYKKLSIFIIVFLTAVVLISTGIKGIVLLVVSSAVGILCNMKKVNRSTMMASIIVPVVLFFSGL